MRRTLAALALAMALPATGLLAPPVRAQVVVVREGDTLSDIAARHQVSLTRLMQANGISDPDLVVVGQRLTIPGGSARPAASGSASSGTVTVQPGDTLSDIAARHGVGVTRLMQANGISDANLVMVGQRLTIPGASGRSAAPAAPSAQPTAPYTVKSGETLSEIAARFNTSTERLIQLNRIQNPDLLTSGTRLRIPMTPRSSAALASAPAARPAPNRNAREHVVQGGESLSVIAERYGTSVSQLVALNRIEDPDRLLAGTRLQLRGTPPAAQSKPAAQPKPASPTQPAAQAQPATATATPATATPASPPTTQAGRAATAASEAESAAAATAAPSPRPQAQPQPEPQPQSVPRPQLSPASTPARAATAATARAATSTAAAATSASATAATTEAAASAAAAAPATAARSAASSATSAARTTATATRAAAAAPTTQSTALQQASARSSTASTAASRIGATTGGVQASAARTTATTPSTTPAAATTTTARPAPASTATGSGAASSGDWRSYGPLQIDWSKWQAMGGSHVAPSLNSDGKARYLAVNCTARKLNRTTASGQWNSWESPQEDFETKLVQDICREKGN
ncbi:MAG: LysM peptidoglycan-binding domain-containing protein [Cyanobium sp. PLM2.Bin73]|nr:MAG: LysM peptidoglycan-binding domain-containing protein [Cyanobium sp. PLM2.Bin73]